MNVRARVTECWPGGLQFTLEHEGQEIIAVLAAPFVGEDVDVVIDPDRRAPDGRTLFGKILAIHFNESLREAKN